MLSCLFFFSNCLSFQFCLKSPWILKQRKMGEKIQEFAVFAGSPLFSHSILAAKVMSLFERSVPSSVGFIGPVGKAFLPKKEKPNYVLQFPFSLKDKRVSFPWTVFLASMALKKGKAPRFISSGQREEKEAKWEFL